MNTLKKILYLLSQKEKKQLGILLVMALGMSIIDMIGVASIVPFVAVLTNPSLIETNVILKNLFQISNKFGIENSQEFVFVLGVAVFILLIFSLNALSTAFNSISSPTGVDVPCALIYENSSTAKPESLIAIIMDL